MADPQGRRPRLCLLQLPLLQTRFVPNGESESLNPACRLISIVVPVLCCARCRHRAKPKGATSLAKIHSSQGYPGRIQRTTLSLPGWNALSFLFIAFSSRAYPLQDVQSGIMIVTSSGTHFEFCVASSILVASWASTALQLATVTEPITCRVRLAFVVQST